MSAADPKVGEFRLSSSDRIDRAEAKAGFTVVPRYFDIGKDVPDAQGIAPGEVLDLTAKLRSDGTLDWRAPAGRWRILRFGWSLTGKTNHPAPPEATGLEVDKFDGDAVRRYLDRYMAQYRDAAGAALIGQQGVRALLNDSIEVGPANWTPRMVAKFRELRGYDPTPWLPALAGFVIGSKSRSDAFLFDYRRTLADLISTEHYRTIAQVARQNGLKVYGEALENGRPLLGDDMAMRRYTDVPMAALWTYPRQQGPSPSALVDMRGAASVAHIYGQNIAAAESMTSLLAPWAFGPADLKRIADEEFVNGINRPIIHTSVHVPVEDRKPGLALSIFGQYFNRNEAWAELAKPWVDYLSRNALMLQQGRNVADVAYFYGEEAPLTGVYGDRRVTDAPTSVAYDFVNADVIRGALANDGAELVAPGGARYRLLYLGGESRRLTVRTLERILQLVKGGATMVGRRPEGNPSLEGSQAEWTRLVDTLWPGTAETRIGRGRVIAGQDVEAALRRIGVAPDARFEGAADQQIRFVHRQLRDGHSYFVSNARDRTERVQARFRVTGKVPELWHAETGMTEAVSYRIENGETIVPLVLQADESMHVVFRKAATGTSASVATTEPRELAKVEGAWQVAFQPGRGAPATTQMAALAPLDASADDGIRYFSGVATYTTTFRSPAGLKPGQQLWLDLGEVREIAEVKVNGRAVGAVWHAPYRVDVSGALRRGANTLEVRVANLWVNRLIGDAQPGAAKVAWAAGPTYTAKAPLRRSGLIGPVRLLESAVR